MKKHFIFHAILWFAFLSIMPKAFAEPPAVKPIKIEFKLVVDDSSEEQLIFGDEILLSQQDIKSAILSVTDRLNTIGILFRLTEEGKKKLLDLSTQYPQKRFAIFVDDKFITAPEIKGPTGSGSLAIAGGITEEEATEIVTRVNQKN